jgi:hypothetical protein
MVVCCGILLVWFWLLILLRGCPYPTQTLFLCVVGNQGAAEVLSAAPDYFGGA